MPSLTARTAPIVFHVDYNLKLDAHPIAFPIFVEPFVDFNASWLRMESGEGISMEGSTDDNTVVLTAQRTGTQSFRVITPTT